MKYLLQIPIYLIAFLFLFSALLLIYKPTRALALLLSAPILINILLFELLIAHQPGIGILLVLLNALAIYQNRHKYESIIAKDSANS